MAARRAQQTEELESRHADALGGVSTQAAHSALDSVTTGGPYLDDTVEMLAQVDKRAEEMARSVDEMLSTLSA